MFSHGGPLVVDNPMTSMTLAFPLHPLIQRVVCHKNGSCKICCCHTKRIGEQDTDYRVVICALKTLHGIVSAIHKRRIGEAPSTNPSFGMTKTKIWNDTFFRHAPYNVDKAASVANGALGFVIRSTLVVWRSHLFYLPSFLPFDQ